MTKLYLIFLALLNVQEQVYNSYSLKYFTGWRFPEAKTMALHSHWMTWTGEIVFLTFSRSLTWDCLKHKMSNSIQGEIWREFIFLLE